MKIVTCFVRKDETKKDFELLNEEEKAKLADALQEKALKALSVQAQDDSEEIQESDEDAKEDAQEE